MKISLIPQVGNETVHCSQGDTNRQWQFDIYGDKKIDIVDSPNPTYWIEKGGTEELLPTSLLNGIVDLGSLTWYLRSGIGMISNTNASNMAKPSTNNDKANLYLEGKKTDSWTQFVTSGTTGNIVCLSNDGYIGISTTETVPSAFAQAMQGVLLYYQKSTSTPTTSPIKCDIQYTDGLRTDQEFTYRESPTTVDGSAKLKSIYGNTLVWNQIMQNGNFESTSGWNINKASNTNFSVSGNIATITTNDIYAGIYKPTSVTVGHKYFVSIETKNTDGIIIGASAFGGEKRLSANSNYVRTFYLVTATSGSFNYVIYTSVSTSNTINARNFMFIDLTAMFGSGNEPSTVEEFTSLFPLPYYTYDTGSLVSFNGTGIKTVGKNFYDMQRVGTVVAGLILTKDAETGTVIAKYTGGTRYVSFDFMSGSPYINGRLLTNAKYRLSFDVSNFTGATWTVGLRRIATNYPFVSGSTTIVNANGHYSITLNVDTAVTDSNIYVSFSRTGDSTSAFDITFSNIQMELGTAETSFEPYTSQTTDLPISTYFPTGMKSAGSVYDELSNNKAVTRIGTLLIDGNTALQTNGATSTTSNFGVWVTGKANGQFNIVSDRFYAGGRVGEPYTMAGRGANNFVEFRLPLSVPQTIEDGKAWFAQNPTTLCYELATPLENYGVVDLGSLTWNYNATYSIFSAQIVPMSSEQKYKVACSRYSYGVNNFVWASANTYGDKTINTSNNEYVYIKDTSYNDATAFKNAMSGVYLLYEPIEPQLITSATMVTEYGESDLDSNGVVICNEGMSKYSGFHDAKIRVSDGDGDVYSAKFQVHVERKPK